MDVEGRKRSRTENERGKIGNGMTKTTTMHDKRRTRTTTRDGKRRTTTTTRRGKRRTTAATRQGKRRMMTTSRHGKRRTTATEHSKAVGKNRTTTTTTTTATGHGKAVGKNRTATTTKHGRAPKQEERQQQSKGEGKQSLEELIRIVKLRMQQEEEQEQMNGEDEARRESETYRKKESEQEMKWEIGKGKGTERGKVMMSGEERGVGEVTRQEGKGRGETGIRKVWEDWWHVREAIWMNEEWRELSGDVLDVGEKGVGLRQE